MRLPLLLLLLTLPVGALAYHYGPGQQKLALDNAQLELNRAAEFMRQNEFSPAIAAYTAALEQVPTTSTDVRRNIRLERAKAQLQNSQLPEAYDELFALKDELDAEGTSADPKFAADFRKTLADAQYYMTWLQRLEGEPRDAWEPDIEAARQNYKLLAEAARDGGDVAAASRLEGDLEAAVRLARLDLSELQALALPKQCQGCCSGNCQCKGSGKGKKPGRGQQQNKTEDARGAGSGPPPDGKGS